MMIATRYTSTAHLIALDIDGTLTSAGASEVPERTCRAVAAARAAGHHVVLASGRSLAGVLPVADNLRLTSAFLVASNGAVTARMAAGMPDGYEAVSAETFLARPVIEVALEHLPDARIAVEEIGWGYWVSSQFPKGTLNGRQMRLPLDELAGATTTRLVVRGDGVVDTLLQRVRDLGMTAHVGSGDAIDVTPPGLSKATALALVRAELGVAGARVVVVGDGGNDLDMFAWARAGGGRAVAMGHAAAPVREAAGEVTGDLAADGVVAVLNSLLPAGTLLKGAR